MKIALCQINTTLGDFKYNRDLIISKKVKKSKFDVISNSEAA